MNLKFYKCNICDNIFEVINDSSINPTCCNKNMQMLIPNEVDTNREKHQPLYWTKNGIIHVQVGEQLHPMEENHYIQWIILKTNMLVQRKYLKPNDEPKAEFCIKNNEQIEEVFAYCNIHKLWKTSDYDF